jgi:DNA-binding winged helix-turn-helix (wHTH) protein
MNNKIIINNAILYFTEEHCLRPLGVRGKENVLNVPVSRCLELLLQRPGVVISQEEFFREVWQKNGQYVTANTLYQNISLLRKGMREAGLTKNIIKTVPKVGIVFSGTVEIMIEEGNEIVNDEGDSTPQEQAENKNIAAPIEQTALKPRWQENKFLRIGLMSAFIIAVFILLANNRSQSAQFFATHNRITAINQCSVYIDRDDLEVNVEGYVKSLQANNVICNPDEFVYISKSPAHNETLVLFCNVHSGGDLKCSTRFKIDNQHSPMTGLRPLQ